MNVAWHLLDDFVWRGLSLLLVVAYLAYLHRRVKKLEELEYCLKRRFDIQSMTLEVHTDHLASNSSEIGKLDRRAQAQARYARHCTRVAESTAGRLDGRLLEHDRYIAKLDRAGHRHEEMPAEKPKYHVYIDGKNMPPKPDMPRT